MYLDLEHEGASLRAMTPADLTARGVSAAVILAAVKARLCADVDAAAEAARLRLITPGAGQAMEYQESFGQAVSALEDAAASHPYVAGRYPMLDASIGIDLDPQTGAPAVDAYGVARSVKAAGAAWNAAGAAIRRGRLAAKAAINAAGDAEAAIAAASGLSFTP